MTKNLLFPFLALLAMAPTLAAADPTHQVAEIANDSLFLCAPFPRTNAYLKGIQAWRSVVICRVANDVSSAHGGFTAIPAWATLVGDARNGRVAWRYIVAPSGSSMLHLPRHALVSKIAPNRYGDLLVVEAKSIIDFKMPNRPSLPNGE